MNQPAASSTDRRPEYVTLIAVYQFVTAGILFLLSCIIPSIIFSTVFFNVTPSEGVFASIVVAGGALALFLGFGFASVAVGWGLLRMREWARVGAIVLGAFALIGFPIWTIAAILVLVYLTSEEARAAFTQRQQPDQTGDARYHDALAATAAYKTEPAPQASLSPLDETRPMTTRHAPQTSNGGAVAPPDAHDVTREIEAIPMPPPSDPSDVTEALYDDESDVSDHYRRWKASLSQETTEMPVISPDPDETTEQPTLEMESIPDSGDDEPTQEPETKPRRQWFRPPEEAGMDDRILRPRDEDDETES